MSIGREFKGSRIIVWPHYIDETLPRSRGRKIARNKSVRKPSLEEVKTAAELLNLNPIVENDKRYPREWLSPAGRVIVDKKMPKNKTLELIASKILELRRKPRGA
ncbi:MAG: signal recognition particle protein Srp19 [Thermoprotei archaeon]|nr:signal recognition particle protein Srp19 [Thermoprotei archaeon]